MKNQQNDNQNDYIKYRKNNFFHRLPFGLKATFIKYWFYGALYFFCFMGLGNYLPNENLVLVTGLIGGVLFDIALYNIYILIADTREEASKWWFYKSKKFYSIFINVIILIGLFFTFYFIIVPINERKPESLVWLFQEPLSSALLLTVLDTGIVWLKNLFIMWFRKVFKRDGKGEFKKEDYIKILDVTPVSVSIELNNKDIYYADKPYNVLLDNEIILKKMNVNVLTIFDLKPDTQYRLSINRQNVVFTTPKIYKAYKVYEGNDLQKVIDMADQYSLIIVNKGTYKVKSLALKSNITLYLRKDAVLLASQNENDYPVVSAYNKKKDEINGNYQSEPMDMRQSIIHIDHLKNVKVVGEGTIDGQAQLSSSWKKNKFKVAPPHLISINHSSNVSVIGLHLKNSPQWTIHPFFSSNVNLINLEIANDKNSLITDGIVPECSSEVNIIGNNLTSLNDCIAIKAGNKEIAQVGEVSSKNIVIRNCLMKDSKSAITLGNASSAGIHSINIAYSYLINNETGIAVKTKRGNRNTAIIKDIDVSSVKMDGVRTPITMNMFDSSNESKRYKHIDSNTPYLENFAFKNIEAKNFEYAAGYFYGLPEKYIYEISIIDSTFTPKDICQDGLPLTMDGVEKCSKKGFIAKNVRTINLKNVKLERITGHRIDIENVSEIIDNH